MWRGTSTWKEQYVQSTGGVRDEDFWRKHKYRIRCGEGGCREKMTEEKF